MRRGQSGQAGETWRYGVVKWQSGGLMRLVFWGIVAATLGVYAAMGLWSVPKLMGYSEGALIFDMRPWGYSPADARSLLEALGAEGRAFYLTAQQGLDRVFPALLALTLVFSFRRLYPRGPALALSVLAVVYAAFDYGENALIARLLSVAPEAATPELVAAASRLSMAKYGAVAIALMALLLGLVRRWRARG